MTILSRASARSCSRSWTTVLFLASASLWVGTAHAQLRLDITQGVRDAVPIAVVPFGGQAEGGATDVAAVVANDLQSSGRFKPLERRDMVTRPTTGAAIRFEDWRLLRSDFIVVGRVEPDAAGLGVTFELFNVQTGQPLLSQRLTTTERGLRATAHRIADLVFERLTGIAGAFSTRIAYVTVEGRPPKQRYRLVVADADGYAPRTVTESSEPLMSPAWAPDGQSLAYVSFEGKASAIYVQRLASGERRRVSARLGINGAPAWSPDGRKLALTLSRDGNLDIYVLDLATQALTRLTSDGSIDTEPEWSRDGSSIYFTSDRAGSAQVYRMEASAGQQPQRLTFTNGYNARPRASPDGQALALVTLDRGAYRIATFDLKTRNLHVLTDGRQDESPSYAPNGAVIIHATRSGSRGALAMVSSDGRFQQRLSSDTGDVREPVWSPYPAGSR
ncbi:MAG TPA: Tol-Pal system beta propeller repeat protein TolB [Steroidobacteraceae bacterium]|nr:Tol-Pal system beta propeller repeat protein TolB [Steroidobacteraceae bacterium]